MAVLSALIGLGMMLVLVLFTVGLLLLATRAQRARDEVIARQVGLTDAIHRRFGAVVAPVVERRRGGGWRAVIPVPFARPDMVAGVVSLTERTLAGPGGTPVEILLTAQRRPAAMPERGNEPISRHRNGAAVAA
jgi:hypothetical protein